MTSESTGFAIDTPPTLTNAALRVLYEHWLGLCRDAGGLPQLQSFDPLTLPRLLPHIWIIEVDAESHRLRMRLAGESINAIYGRNVGGRYFRDVFDLATTCDLMVRRYSRVLSEPAVLHCEGSVYSAAGRAIRGERVGMPMLGRTGSTEAVLGLTIYFESRPRSLDDPLLPATEHFYRIRAANHRAPEIAGG